MSGPRIGLAIDEADWHLAELRRSAEAGGIDLRPLRLADCAFDTAAPHGLRLPGFGDALPDAVLVRAMGGGGFEQVTRRLGILHALHGLGVPVLNDARAIERCVDKSATSARLARAGLPTPRTWTVEGREAALAIVTREIGAGELVCKPLFGAQGRGLVRVAEPDNLPIAEAVGEVYHLQRYVPPAGDGFRDHRLFVIGEQVVAAMTRHAEGWITNLGRGGRAEAFLPDAGMTALALAAARCVGAWCAGVDVLRGHDRDWVLEVNSMPGWRGLQRVTKTDVAAELLAGVLAWLSRCRA